MGLGKNRLSTVTVGAIGASTALCLSSAVASGQIPCHYEVTHIIQAPVCPLTGSSPPTIASAISPDGHFVAGFYYVCGSGNFRAFRYDTTTSQFLTLPLPAGYFEGQASDVNDAGQVVGYLTDNTTGFKAFAYQDGQYTILPPEPGGAWSVANGINASGTVAATGVWPMEAILLIPGRDSSGRKRMDSRISA